MKRFRHALDLWVLLGRPHLVRLAPGDVIVIETTAPASVAGEIELTRRVEDAFGYRHQVLVLTGGATLTVITDPEGPRL